MREKLIELIAEGRELCEQIPCEGCTRSCKGLNDCIAKVQADHLLANGVIVTPCVAMVEQFIKDGEFDKKRTAHNGKYAVVYVDKSKWNCPLIDITEQSYNMEKAEERIQALKGERHAEIH